MASLWKLGHSTRWLFFAVVLAASFGSHVNAAPPSLWVTSSAHRIWRNDSAGSSNHLDLYSAKNQVYSFQIGIHGPSGGLSNVNVTSSDFNGPGSAVINRSHIALFREHYVYVPKAPPYYWREKRDGTNPPHGPGWYPDGLIPFEDPETGQRPYGGVLHAVPFDVAEGTNQVIWVDIYIPVDVPGALYSALFTVTSDQGDTSARVTVHVWNFQLPVVPSFKTSYQSTPANQNAYMQHILLRNRVSPAWDEPEEEPTLIHRWGLTSVNAWFSTGINVSNCATKEMPPSPSIARFRAVALQHQPDILLYNFTADEISRCPNQYPRLRDWAANMHAAGIQNLVTVAPVPELEDDGTGTGRSAVDIWVELPEQWASSAAEIEKVQAKGDAVWSYNVLVQDGYSPKHEINFSPLDYRLNMGFISQSLGLSGFQQWAVDNWTLSPWNDVTGNMSVPSDGILVYPGREVGIVGYAPSIRLKWTRDGVNDFEYVQILKRLGHGPWALDQVQTIARDWKHWTRDYKQLEAVRVTLGNEIERIVSAARISRAAAANP
jgi:Domain of unknown function (DUF4091)